MFERFASTYGSIREQGRAASPWSSPIFEASGGCEQFMAANAGASFGGGLYRVHDAASGALGRRLIGEAFPTFGDRAAPFGYDWLGRQFALDRDRVSGGEPLVLLIEPGTGEVLEIPANFREFHDQELVDYPDAALALEFFEEWRRASSGIATLERLECAGYRVPLFLGGSDTVDNLEVIGLDIYWTLAGQLRSGTRHMPLGSTIGGMARG